MAMTIMNFATPKVRAEHELLFNKPVSGHTLLSYLSRTYMFNKPTSDYLLALATLGDTTKNRNAPIFFAPPKVAKASSHMLLSLA